MIAVVPVDHIVSYAQNREDVVLWRALADVTPGRYVEIGANHPTTYSATKAFYEHGWSGITVEPIEEYVLLHRAERPRDTQVRAAVVAEPVDEVTLYQIDSTGLSTTRQEHSSVHQTHGWTPHAETVPGRTLDQVLDEQAWRDHPTHFMVVDVAGAEAEVLAGVDLRAWRPWVVVVESTAPLSTTPTHGEWEALLLDAGYVFRLFDGVSRFYVAAEHDERIGAALSYPACALDPFVDDRLRTVQMDRDQTLEDLRRWRAEALQHWAPVGESGGGPSDDQALALARAEIAALRSSTSWRVTRPLRAVSARLGRR